MAYMNGWRLLRIGADYTIVQFRNGFQVNFLGAWKGASIYVPFGQVEAWMLFKKGTRLCVLSVDYRALGAGGSIGMPTASLDVYILKDGELAWDDGVAWVDLHLRTAYGEGWPTKVAHAPRRLASDMLEQIELEQPVAA